MGGTWWEWFDVTDQYNDRFNNSNNIISSNLFYDNQNAFTFDNSYQTVVMEKNIFFKNNNAARINDDLTV